MAVIDPSRLTFVLVRPRNPNNIGAVARAMANFGASDLRLVEPYEAAWRETRAAPGAQDLLKSARVQTLAEAVADSSLVLGTGDGRRAVRRPVVSLPGLADYLSHNLSHGGRVSILFGSEKTGLSNADLGHCRAVLRIPTRPRTPSMNLGQAAAVIAYELSRAEPREAPKLPRLPPALAGQVEDLVSWTLRAMDGLAYMPRTARAVKAERVRRALSRLSLARQDAGFLRALLKRAAARAQTAGEASSAFANTPPRKP